MRSGVKTAVWAGALVVWAFTLRTTPHPQAAARQDQAPAPAAKTDARTEAVLQKVCGQCHDWQRVTESRRSKAEWGRVIDDMIGRGATGTDEEYNTLFDYVLRHNSLVNVNRAPADELCAVLGLTESEAGAIISYRTANGKIADFEALKKVKGLDPDRLEAARPAIFY